MVCYKHNINYYLQDCPECLKEKYQKKNKLAYQQGLSAGNAGYKELAGINEIANEKYKIIISQREKFIEAFVAETGLYPSECEMIEEHINEPNFVGIKIYFRKR